MNKTLPATTLSLLALVFGSNQTAYAETPLDFAPPAQPEQATVQSTAADTIAISFDPPQAITKTSQETINSSLSTSSYHQQSNHQQPITNHQQLKTNTNQPATANQQPLTANPADDIFSGGSNSLVARAVGSAEGTRTPEGHKTSAYHGHTDPGNGVWNLGSFSYQHEAANPEEADEKQLARLAQQDQSLREKAIALGIPEYEADLSVRLNGIDLANQSPLAALADDGGGYIDRLKQAQEMGLIGSEAVLWARVRSYLDPDTNQWNAPGLGNTVENISHDQQRRMDAIDRAFALYQAQVATIAEQPAPQPSEKSAPDVTEQIISQNLSSEPNPSPEPELSENRVEQIISQAPAANPSSDPDSPSSFAANPPIAFDLAPPVSP
jgi:hypothetical protein